jgi:hypothetical protein
MEEEVCRPFMKLGHCFALDGRVLWSILMCYAARRPATSTLTTTTSRWHKACIHCSPRRRFGLIYWDRLERLKLVAYKGGTCFLRGKRVVNKKYFRGGLLDGTRGENWGRAVEVHMLDGCTTRGGIEVGGL